MNREVKKLFCSLLLAIFLLLGLAPLTTQAQGIAEEIGRQSGAFAGEQGANLGEPSDVRSIVARIIKIFLSLIGIMAIAYTVYGGYLIMTSAGEEEKVKKGKSVLRNAVIGIIVVLSAWGIVILATYIAQGGRLREVDYWELEIERDRSDYYNRDRLEQDTVPFSPF